jgi:hypothetical protein
MSDGRAMLAAVNAGSSQCPETTTMAAGFEGSVPDTWRSQSAVVFQVSAGSPVRLQSMKKQGPPPWGMKKVGIV